jgi:SanA protein
MKYLASLFGLVVIITLLSSFSYFFVSYKASNKLYDCIDSLPTNKTALLLGTSKKMSNGKPNLYFYYRIEAAVQLFQQKKIKYIIISGDHSSRYYNEPQDMKNELLKRGIPEKYIYLDFAGFRTFDSILRAKHIFGQTKLTIISQKFHNERALFICQNKGIDAVAFNAKTPNIKFKTIVREYLARIKLFLDLYILHVKPKYLGDKITIEFFNN